MTGVSRGLNLEAFAQNRSRLTIQPQSKHYTVLIYKHIIKLSRHIEEPLI